MQAEHWIVARAKAPENDRFVHFPGREDRVNYALLPRIASAMGQGKTAARAIHDYLNNH